HPGARRRAQGPPAGGAPDQEPRGLRPVVQGAGPTVRGAARRLHPDRQDRTPPRRRRRGGPDRVGGGVTAKETPRNDHGDPRVPVFFTRPGPGRPREALSEPGWT